jgi:signal transduction histidine kinase
MDGADIIPGSRRALAVPPLEPEQPAGGNRHGRLSIRRFKLEAAVLLLLLSTFALMQFQDLFARRTLSLRPDNLAPYLPYWYNDAGEGGRSAITVNRARPLVWSCDLRPGYEYPFCGYGILLDPLGRGRGLDLRAFDHVTLRFRYSGPAERLRLNIARTDPLKGPSNTVHPGELGFAVVQGEQSVRLDLDELTVPIWWAIKYHADALGKPPRDNVTAIELQPGKGAGNGRYLFAVDSITFEGRQISQAQIYLGLLVAWVSLITLFLARRVLGIRRAFEHSQAVQVRESRELRLAKAAAESASAAKSAFLANMSHELRTPLNAILGYAQILEHEELTERQAAAARTIQRSGAHLLTLITDILDLAKIEAGRLELAPVTFDLHACIRGVAEMMQLRATEKGLPFACRIGSRVPRYALGDERRLRQVLINLLGNAIKFTPSGRVAMQVSATGDAGAERLKVEVRDTGPGIGEANKARIFEPFEQFGDTERNFGGTGLGLSISRQIIELMGGRIDVESAPGRGSRFWFEIPLHVAGELTREAVGQSLLYAGEVPDEALVPPPADQLQVLHKLALAGNMRAIRAFAEKMAAETPQYGPFARRLKALAAAYQSPAILDLVSRYTNTQEVA